MGDLLGGIDRVELVVRRVRSSTLEWKRKEFYDKGGTRGNWLGLLVWVKQGK
jgi:hypothetical protein